MLRGQVNPTSSTIRYLPATRVPTFRTWRGVSRVLVTEAPSGPAHAPGPSGAAQSLQNLESSLFSAWHLGHSTIMLFF